MDDAESISKDDLGDMSEEERVDAAREMAQELMHAEGAQAKVLSILVVGDEFGTSGADMLEFLRVLSIICNQLEVKAYVYSGECR
jgi:hypothetical protein